MSRRERARRRRDDEVVLGLVVAPYLAMACIALLPFLLVVPLFFPVWVLYVLLEKPKETR